MVDPKPNKSLNLSKLKEEHTNLLGFLGDKMVFENTSEGSAVRSAADETNAKKFLYLKGRKFEILKSDAKLQNLQIINKKKDGIIEPQMDTSPQIIHEKMYKKIGWFNSKNDEMPIDTIKEMKSTSTNTESVSKLNKQVQTDDPLDNIFAYLFSDCTNTESNVIVGKNVNMGFKKTEQTHDDMLKLQFFNDLKDCLTWDSGNLPIHKAVVERNVNFVKRQCVVLKARKLTIDIPNSSNLTPLHLSVLHNADLEMVRVLLEYKADMSILDPHGNNVLHLAVENDREDLLQLFLTNQNNLDIDQFNHEGLTALMLCAFKKDRVVMAEMLLNSGATANQRDLKSGKTAIFHAAENHNVPLVSLLLDISVDTKIRNFFGMSVHDAMFELEDMPKEIKYPILHHKRKAGKHEGRLMVKRKKLEIVPTYQKIVRNVKFIVNDKTQNV